MTAAMMVAAGGVQVAKGPKIPNFGGPSCPPDSTFCWSWVQDNWHRVLLPRLIEHIYITLIALGCGLAITLVAALVAYRFNWFEKGFAGFSLLLYTIPSLAFFRLFGKYTGFGLLTIELGLTGYTFLLLFRNILTGLRSAPASAMAAATGMGMTSGQRLFQINVPLALPSIIAGLRVSSVTAIALAAIAANIAPLGLGAPIFDAQATTFKTELIAASVLAILLALVGDIVFVLLGRAVTPWVRARAGRRR